MNLNIDKKQDNKSTSVANINSNKEYVNASTYQFVDNRSEAVVQEKLQEQPIQKKENNTGLPDNLKSGMENLSGMSLDHVKVHKNSSKPAAVQAHAYAQGSDIHLAPGKEKHLPHELSHVVQQAQGRVQPTTSVNGVAVNDNEGLENEADVMGRKALQVQLKQKESNHSFSANRLLNNSKNARSVREIL